MYYNKKIHTHTHTHGPSLSYHDQTSQKSASSKNIPKDSLHVLHPKVMEKENFLLMKILLKSFSLYLFCLEALTKDRIEFLFLEPSPLKS